MKPTKEQIRRTVASSTAIETGQPVEEIEAQLENSRFRDVSLWGLSENGVCRKIEKRKSE